MANGEASNAVFNNEASSKQRDSMTPDHPHDNPDHHVSFNEWLDYMAEEFPTIDAMRFYETREIVDKVEPEPEAEPEATNYMGDDWQPDYSKTAEYEGAGITADLTPADSLVGAGVEEVMAYGEANGWNPALLGILAAISTKGKSLKKTPKLKDEGMLSLPKKNLDEGFGSATRLENAAHRRGKTFTPKMTKDGKPYKVNPNRTAKSGEVVKGTSTSNVGKAKVNAKSGQS